jgi:hypothetical protein
MIHKFNRKIPSRIPETSKPKEKGFLLFVISFNYWFLWIIDAGNLLVAGNCGL